MKAIDFMPDQTIQIAENQAEYETLPAIRFHYVDGSTAWISAWIGSKVERLKILFGKPIYLVVLTDQQHPPIVLSTSKERVGLDELEKIYKEEK